MGREESVAQAKAAQHEKEQAAFAKKQERRDKVWAQGAKDTSAEKAAAEKAAAAAARKGAAAEQAAAEEAEGSNKGMNKKKVADPNALKKMSKGDAKDRMAKAKAALEKAEKKKKEAAAAAATTKADGASSAEGAVDVSTEGGAPAAEAPAADSAAAPATESPAPAADGDAPAAAPEAAAPASVEVA